MHQPRPYGLHTIGQKLTSNDQAFIHATAKRFSNLKEVSELESMRMVYDLPDGGYVVVQDMGGNFRIVAHKPKNHEFITRDGLATDYIPMLYSGEVLNQITPKTDGVTIRLTEQTRRRLIEYDPEKTKPDLELSLHRFRIDYDLKFDYFKPKNTGDLVFTQYHKLRATWYSGAISEIIQIVGGYGRHDFEALPNKPYERKVFLLPDLVRDKVREHVISQRLPAYDGIPNIDGKYQYNYNFSHCNAVSFDKEDNPWLLQINATGVYAMPLPIIPATTSPDFLKYLREVKDEELISIVERFGGLPSGEDFLLGKDFQAWYRAGVIIKICDTKDFYKHDAFYYACGWAFNSKGSEGFNTCWSFDDSGMRIAYGFKINLNLGVAKNNGLVTDIRDISAEDQAILNRYIYRLNLEIPDNNHRERAIRYKISRTSAKDLLVIAKGGQVDIGYWENLISEPIAEHEGSMREVSKGPMYWGISDPKSFGYLKFPQYEGLGCESFDMTMPYYEGDSVRCDTIVFGSYINDQLTVIKYFLDNRVFDRELESSFEDVMIIGEWEKTEKFGGSRLEGYLYTTDFDDRQETSKSVVFTKVTGEDLGYGNPLYSTPAILAKWGGIGRSRYYSYRTEVSIKLDGHLAIGVCVPVFSRDCILYALTETSESRSYSDDLTRESIPDPTSYSLWTFDPIFHFIGGEGKGYPEPTTGDLVYANYNSEVNYKPTKYSWFSDSGNWLEVPDGGYIDVSGTCSSYTDRSRKDKSASGFKIGGQAPQIEEYSKSQTFGREESGGVFISIKVKGAGVINKSKPDTFYFVYSPEDGGGIPVYFQRYATWITAGKKQYSSVSEKGASGIYTYWGNTELADHKSAHCFIGVINE